MQTQSIRIGAERGLKYFKGETFLFTLKIKDANGDYIDWTGATFFDIVLTKTGRPSITIPLSAISVNTDGFPVVNYDFADEQLAVINKGSYKFKIPMQPAGGGPLGYFNGTIQILA